LGDVSSLTLDKSSEVTAIRAAYGALTTEQKALVTKLNLLTEAEQKIADLKALADKEAAAKKLALELNLSEPYYGPLKLGSTGPDVKLVQQALIEKGYSLTVDGVFGSETQKFVLKFQWVQGLEHDGIVGLDTWIKLFGDTCKYEVLIKSIDKENMTLSYDLTGGMEGPEDALHIVNYSTKIRTVSIDSNAKYYILIGGSPELMVTNNIQLLLDDLSANPYRWNILYKIEIKGSSVISIEQEYSP
jgi:hypothetical protein